MYLSQNDIQALPRIKRLNIINAVTGIKPANLIGTRSADGRPNVAIFSSVFHLGSDPALIGFIFRPQDEKPRDTYLNIKSTGTYTINHVNESLIEKAHFTSAKFDPETSEFDICGLTEEYLHGFHAPFVKESKLKIGLEMVEEIPINVNKTIMMIGRIVHLDLPEKMVDQEGNMNLEIIQSAGVSGVDSYYALRKIGQFPYAHVKDVPDSLNS